MPKYIITLLQKAVKEIGDSTYVHQTFIGQGMF